MSEERKRRDTIESTSETPVIIGLDHPSMTRELVEKLLPNGEFPISLALAREFGTALGMAAASNRRRLIGLAILAALLIGTVVALAPQSAAGFQRLVFGGAAAATAVIVFLLVLGRISFDGLPPGLLNALSREINGTLDKALRDAQAKLLKETRKARPRA